MKFIDSRPFADPKAAAQKLMEIANGVEAVQDGRIFIELINGPFLYEHKGRPAKYGAGLKLVIDRSGFGSTRAAPIIGCRSVA